MKHKQTLALLIALSLSASTLVGCSDVSIAELENIFISDEDCRANPLFWDIATPVAGSENLYELRSNAFSGKPITEIAAYGDDILMICRAIYKTVNPVGEIDATDWEGFDEEDAVPQLSFELYSPWRDSMIASIDRSDIAYSEYVVLNDARLLLYSFDSDTFAIYDSMLELEGTYTLDGFSETYSSEIVSAPDGGLFIYSHEDLGTHKISLPAFDETEDPSIPKEATAESIETPIVHMEIIEVAEDNSYYVCGGIDPSTMREVTGKYNPINGSFETLIEFERYASGTYSGNSYLSYSGPIFGAMQYHRDGVTKFFQTDLYPYVKILDDRSFVFTYVEYDENNNSSYGVARYDANGKAISGGTYASSSDGYYGTYRSAVFGGDGLTFLLETHETATPYLLVWDMNQAGQKPNDLTFYDSAFDLLAEDSIEWDTPITMIPDRNSYDFGALTETRQRADELEAKYGIRIFIGEEVPEHFDTYNVEKFTDADVLLEALGYFDETLSYYPDGFFEQLKYGEVSELMFYFGGSITSEDESSLSEAGAFVTTIGSNNKVMVLDASELYMHATLTHEFSHMVDARLEYVSTNELAPTSYSEEGWESLNPPEFEYTNDYGSYNDGGIDYTTYYEYFWSDYAMTYATEDRATLFAAAAQATLDPESSYLLEFLTTPEKAKLAYYFTCIRECFDDSTWPDPLPWETVLYE